MGWSSLADADGVIAKGDSSERPVTNRPDSHQATVTRDEPPRTGQSDLVVVTWRELGQFAGPPHGSGRGGRLAGGDLLEEVAGAQFTLEDGRDRGVEQPLHLAMQRPSEAESEHTGQR
jgi:hypothetical protein